MFVFVATQGANRQLFGFLEDVGMTATQFNLALMYLFFTYGLCEPVSNIMLRRLGPKVWFPIIVTSWGLITTLTCLVHNYRSYVAIRLVLGLTEAGLYPGSCPATSAFSTMPSTPWPGFSQEIQVFDLKRIFVQLGKFERLPGKQRAYRGVGRLGFGKLKEEMSAASSSSVVSRGRLRSSPSAGSIAMSVAGTLTS